jgi:hypothetical protein
LSRFVECRQSARTPLICVSSIYLVVFTPPLVSHLGFARAHPGPARGPTQGQDVTVDGRWPGREVRAGATTPRSRCVRTRRHRRPRMAVREVREAGKHNQIRFPKPMLRITFRSSCESQRAVRRRASTITSCRRLILRNMVFINRRYNILMQFFT